MKVGLNWTLGYFCNLSLPPADFKSGVTNVMFGSRNSTSTRIIARRGGIGIMTGKVISVLF